MQAAVLETLFTANTKPAEAGFTKVETRKRELAKKPAEVQIDADPKDALAAMDKIESEGKALAKTRDFDPKIDADIAKAETKVEDLRRELEVLGRMDASPEVDADIEKARAALSGAESRLKALNGLKAEMRVEADTSSAEESLDDVQDSAGESGGAAGKAFLGGLVGGLASTPVAGIVVGLVQDIGDALTAGLDNELREDQFAAATGLDEVTVGRLGRVAAEAYANNFGESIRDNLDTAKVAIQGGLLDPNATKRDAQAVVQSLSGISDILQEDVQPVSRATTQLLRTGLAKTADEAFDIIIKGQQKGLNASEDWLDTINEYSTQWRKLGLDGPQAVGLLSQAVRAGARDTDVAADALKEFSIRAVDGSVTTKAGFEAIGLSAKEMSERIAAGGPTATAALDETLDRLRAIEDPAARSAAAVQLFGTQAEDLGDALYAFDVSTAVDQLGQFQGAAKSALDTLGDNAASQIETAKRNIQVAADGLAGALASAFNPQIEAASTFVTENREAVLGFLLDIANGAFDAGRAFVQGIGNAGEAVGTFVAGPLADIVDGVASLLNGLDNIPGVDTGDAEKSMRDLAEEMRGADESARDFAETLEDRLIRQGIDPAQDALNEFAAPLLADAALHDVMVQLADDIDQVGYSAKDGTALISAFQYAQDGTITASKDLDAQLRAVVASLDEQTAAGQLAGQGQQELSAQYNASRDALILQLEAMGLTKEQAEQLISTYGLIPERVDTQVAAETADAQSKSDLLNRTLTTIGFQKPNPYVTVSGVDEGQRKLELLQRTLKNIDGFNTTVGVGTVLAPGVSGNARGNLVMPMASGAVLGAPDISGVGQFVPPRTPRLVGDRLDVPELYAPMDQSTRTKALVLEGFRRTFGFSPMADGGVAGSAATASPSSNPGLTRQDLDYLADRIGEVVLAGAREVSHQSLETAARSQSGSRSSRGLSW